MTIMKTETTTNRRLHLSSDCLAAVSALRDRYPDLMQLKGDSLYNVVARALLSYVSKDNPIELRTSMTDTNGTPLFSLDRVLPFVRVPR